jgi:hypothetical protein
MRTEMVLLVGVSLVVGGFYIGYLHSKLAVTLSVLDTACTALAGIADGKLRAVRRGGTVKIEPVRQ